MLQQNGSVISWPSMRKNRNSILHNFLCYAVNTMHTVQVTRYRWVLKKTFNLIKWKTTSMHVLDLGKQHDLVYIALNQIWCGNYFFLLCVLFYLYPRRFLNVLQHWPISISLSHSNYEKKTKRNIEFQWKWKGGMKIG